MKKLISASIGAIAFLALAAQPALADHVKAQVNVAAHTSVKVEQGYVIDAHVEAGGKAVGEATVRYYEVVDFFGTREMVLGSATTDSQGTASFTYLPAQTGEHRIVVKFPGRDHLSPAQATFTLNATIARPAPRAERPALAQFSDRVPYVVGLIVIAVWALIAFALVGTARGVIGGARGTSRREDPA